MVIQKTPDEIAARGATPSFLGYQGTYPAVVCTSIGPDIVHGIPSPKVRLRRGDVLSVDCGLVLDGYHADSACTWIVGNGPTSADVDVDADADVDRLVGGTYEALLAGIAALRPGNRLGDVSSAIGSVAAHHSTVRSPRTGSTRWRSPTTAPGSSRHVRVSRSRWAPPRTAPPRIR